MSKLKLLDGLERIDLIKALNSRLNQINLDKLVYDAGNGIEIENDDKISVKLDDETTGFIENPLYESEKGLRFNTSFIPQIHVVVHKNDDGQLHADLSEFLYARPTSCIVSLKFDGVDAAALSGANRVMEVTLGNGQSYGVTLYGNDGQPYRDKIDNDLMLVWSVRTSDSLEFYICNHIAGD